MRIAFTLLLLLAFAGAAFWIVQGEDTPRRPIDFEPTSYDFGRVRVGEIRDLTLTLSNTTQRQISVICKTNCACVKLGQGATGSMEPGETRDVYIRVQPSHPLSIQGKKLQIYTNHPDQQYAEIPFQGVIVAPFLVHPFPLRLGALDTIDALRGPHTAVIKPGEGFTIRMHKVEPDPRGLFNVTTTKNEDGTIAVTATLAEGKRPNPGRFGAAHKIHMHVHEGTEAPTRMAGTVRIEGFWRGDKDK